MSEPRQNVKLALFALSGNQCAFPDCHAAMFEENSIVGQICHIHSPKPQGPRYKHGLSEEDLNSIENLILLCLKHHKIVDDHPEQYDAERLQKMKRERESRAVPSESQVLHRLIDALSPKVPENWWERPKAPTFRLGFNNSKPSIGQWVFKVALEQIDGGDIGNLRYCYRLGEIEYELNKPTFERKRKWQLAELAFQPQGQPLELEIRFWWDGDERSVTYCWEKEGDFQTANYTIRY